MPTLNYSEVAGSEAPSRWLYLLHGIYGNGRNWGSLARRLTETRPEWGVILVDLRLHGGSTDGFQPPHTVEACARDVEELEAAIVKPADAILGHSFGGKVALLRASHETAPSQIWVADSTLRVGEPSGSAWRVIEIVRKLPPAFESRNQLAEAMVAEGYEREVGLWLGMNLERRDDRFHWKLDWDGIEEMLRDYFRTDVWPVVEDPPAGTELHLIRAIRSDSIDAESAARIEAAGQATGRVHLHEVEAGHWINVDNPDAVLALLERALPGEE